MTAEEILCRWAEVELKLPLNSVQNAYLEEDFDPGYSEYTPGEGHITVLVVDGKEMRTYPDSSELTMRVCRFAADLLNAIGTVVTPALAPLSNEESAA